MSERDWAGSAGFGRSMLGLLLVGGVCLSSAAGWMARAGAGTGGHGGAHGHGEGGFEEEGARHFAFHPEYFTLPFPSYQMELLLLPGESLMAPGPPGTMTDGMFDGAPGHVPGDHHHAGQSGHITPDHHAGPAGHHDQTHHGHVMQSIHAAGHDGSSQDRDHNGGQSDDGAGANTQPAPTAQPSFQRPPGAVGPGRRAFGWAGPGLPGPGRRTRPPR